MLRLPIERKWFNMILSGEKKDEYREIKPYWTVRIIHWLDMVDMDEGSVKNLHDLLRRVKCHCEKPVILQNGYGRNAPEAEVMCKLSIGTGREEWGAVPGKAYYRFHIEEIGRTFGIEKKEVEYGN